MRSLFVESAQSFMGRRAVAAFFLVLAARPPHVLTVVAAGVAVMTVTLSVAFVTVAPADE